jgi:universal stress protein A
MYKHVLLATDLIEASESVAAEAKRQTEIAGAKLSIVYVIEPISTFGFPLVTDLGNEGIEHARAALSSICEILDFDANEQYVRTGSPKREILELAKEIGIDLIVVGSHGRHGLSRLLGSTAIGIIHGSECDVLVVKQTEESTAAVSS